MSYVGLFLLAFGIVSLLRHRRLIQKERLAKPRESTRQAELYVSIGIWGGIIAGLFMLASGDWSCS